MVGAGVPAAPASFSLLSGGGIGIGRRAMSGVEASHPAWSGSSGSPSAAACRRTASRGCGDGRCPAGASLCRDIPVAMQLTTRDVYVAGLTDSTNFPGTVGGAQSASGGNTDAFVARLSTDLTAPHQATYLGGANVDGAQGPRDRADDGRRLHRRLHGVPRLSGHRRRRAGRPRRRPGRLRRAAVRGPARVVLPGLPAVLRRADPGGPVHARAPDAHMPPVLGVDAARAPSAPAAGVT